MKNMYVIKTVRKKLLSKIKIYNVPIGRFVYKEIALPRGISKRRCERLWRTLKPTVGSVILPPHCSANEFGLPQKCVFSVNKALSNLLIETAFLLLSGNEDKSQKMSLCIADRAGKYAAFAERFMTRCKTLKIYTENPCAYFKACEGMLLRCGAEPIISDKPGKCDILLLPHSHLICIGSRRLELTADCVQIIGETHAPAAMQLAVMCGDKRVLRGKCSISLCENGNKINIGKIKL